MSTRTLGEIPVPSLRRLILLALSPSEIWSWLGRTKDPAMQPCSVADRLACAAHKDPVLCQKLTNRLEELLGNHYPQPNAVADISPAFHKATKSVDVAQIASILWRATQQPGLAWRRFEARVEATIELLVFQRPHRDDVSFSKHPLGSTPVENACGTKETIAQNGEIRLDQCSCGCFQLVLGHVTLRFEEESVNALYEMLGVALGTVALRQLQKRSELRLVPPIHNAAK